MHLSLTPECSTARGLEEEAAKEKDEGQALPC